MSGRPPARPWGCRQHDIVVIISAFRSGFEVGGTSTRLAAAPARRIVAACRILPESKSPLQAVQPRQYSMCFSAGQISRWAPLCSRRSRRGLQPGTRDARPAARPLSATSLASAWLAPILNDSVLRILLIVRHSLFSCLYHSTRKTPYKLYFPFFRHCRRLFRIRIL